MNKEGNYEDCLKFIENELHIRLYDFQKEIIKCFCEGKEVRTCRCAGRTFCADAFGKYIAHLYDRNDYTVEPDVVIPYQRLVRNGLLDESHVERNRMLLSLEAFERDYCSK